MASDHHQHHHHHHHNLLLPQLPEEVIIFHILTKLPTKSLLRFLSVCKSWYSATSHPLFLSLRRRHHHPKSLSHIVLISSSSTSHHLLSVPISPVTLHHPSPLPTLLLSLPLHRPLSAKPANGLLLLHFPNHLYSDRADLPATLFNPRTREIFCLPQNAPTNDNHDNSNGDRKVKVLYHFGYDLVDGVYKVLQIWRFIDANLEMSETSLAFRVLSLGSNHNSEWRWIRPNLPLFCCSYSALFSSSCVSNGGIHWVVRRKNCVLAFDFHHEQFHLIPFPQPFINNNKVEIEEEHLVEVGTCLGLLLKTSCVKKKMEMWVLKDYQKQKWVKEESFEYDMSDFGGVPVPMGTVNEDDEQILVFKPMGKKMEELGRLLYYDIKRRRFRGAEIPGLSEWLSSNDVRDYSFDVYEENVMSLSSVLGT